AVAARGLWTPASGKTREKLLQAKPKGCRHPALPVGQQLLQRGGVHPPCGEQMSLPPTWSRPAVRRHQMKKASRRTRALGRRARIPTVGSDSSPSHLSPGRHQPSERVDAQVFLRECHQCLRVQEKLHEDIAEMREENESLSRQLSKAERKADGLEKEVDQLKSALLEKTSALDWTERELRKAKRQTLDWYGVCLLKHQKRADAIKKAEELQQQLAQLQSENFLLRQQLGDAQNKTAQERMRTEAQLQGELADAVRKQHTAETALNASTHQCNLLKAENSRLQEDLDKAKAKACELSAQLELQSQKSLQLEALNKEMGQMVTTLSARLATPGSVITVGGGKEPAVLTTFWERSDKDLTQTAWKPEQQHVWVARKSVFLSPTVQCHTWGTTWCHYEQQSFLTRSCISHRANERLAEARRSNGSQKAECEQDQGSRGPSVNPSGS
ncbi:unnamed protein product, partial [Bubo scandiacus]